MSDTGVLNVLVRASREIESNDWVFIGFNWPILASRVARRLGKTFVEVFEAGAAIGDAPDLLPSSTTDYNSYPNELEWRGVALDVLAMIPRMNAILLDASTVDLMGQVNTFGEGPAKQPTFRSAGGGGSPDVASRARRLILINAGNDLRRIQEQVEHVTAAPARDAEIMLICKGGTAQLGAEPRVTEVFDSRDGEEFVKHLQSLGAAIEGATSVAGISSEQSAAATSVLKEAAARGYRSAIRALSNQEGSP